MKPAFKVERDLLTPELRRLARRVADRKPILKAMGTALAEWTKDAFKQPARRRRAPFPDDVPAPTRMGSGQFCGRSSIPGTKRRYRPTGNRRNRWGNSPSTSFSTWSERVASGSQMRRASGMHSQRKIMLTANTA